MKKIFILFGLLPFSLWAELNPSDLNDIEGQLDRLISSSSKIENDTDEIVNYVSLLTGRCYEIIQEQNATQAQIEKIRLLLATLNQTVESFKGDVNTYLVSIDTNLQSAKISLGYCENYLHDIKNTTLNIYEVLSELGTISSELTDLKNTMISKFDMCQSYFGDFLYFLSGLLTVADQLKEDTGIIVNDISTLKDIILSSSQNKKYYLYSVSQFSTPDQPPNEGYAVLPVFGTNYFQTVLSYFNSLLGGQYYLSQTSYFATRQNYLMISNLQSSVSIQTDIATNVAYIASVITNSHDLLKLIASNVVKIAHHTMPTNVAEQYETQQQEQIDQINSSWQEHEHDMSAYESSLTHIPSKLQKPLDDGSEYLSRLNSSSLEVSKLDDEIYSSLPDYHSSLANMSFSLPIETRLTPDLKQIFSILRKCVTTTIWIFTFLFSLFMVQKFVQFVAWIMTLLQPTTCDVFGNISSGSLYRVMGG